jgi:hypothetical protein
MRPPAGRLPPRPPKNLRSVETLELDAGTIVHRFAGTTSQHLQPLPRNPRRFSPLYVGTPPRCVPTLSAGASFSAAVFEAPTLGTFRPFPTRVTRLDLWTSC